MHPQEMRIAIVHIVLVKETGESAEIQARRSSKKVNHILRLALTQSAATPHRDAANTNFWRRF
jgi:hypothetical protein